MSIELLAFADCPAHAEAYAMMRALLVELGRPDVEIEVRWIETDEEALRVGFVGSPTFRWRGRDLLPLGQGEPVGLACRVYRRRDGRISPLPDPDDLREAVALALLEATADGSPT